MRLLFTLRQVGSQSTRGYHVVYFFVSIALAAVSFLRSLAGCGFPLFAPAMYSKLGFGKGDTVLAVVAIAIGCPA